MGRELSYYRAHIDEHLNTVQSEHCYNKITMLLVLTFVQMTTVMISLYIARRFRSIYVKSIQMGANMFDRCEILK